MSQQLMRIFWTLLCFMAFNVSARLGETEEQSRQRYGEPLKKNEDIFQFQPLIDGTVNRTYKFQGWWIRCAFVEGRAARICYMKMSGKDVKPAIQEDEINAILEGEANGGTWQRRSNATLNPAQLLANAVIRPETWINSNGSTAQTNFSHLDITLETPAASAFIKMRDAEKEQQRKANIPKF